jgi:hypothetical protein
MSGWIKIHRKFLDWQWFGKSESVQLFIYLLLKANHKDGQWQGIDIKRGQLITSFGKISSDTGISVQVVRTLLKKFENTNEINVKSTNKFTMLTILKYECYQDENENTNKQLTNNQQTTNKQLTTNKNVKNNKENIYSFFNSLIEYGFNKDLVNDWIEVRKAKKLTNTKTAFDKFILEVQKSKLDKNEILKTCVEKSWGGFNSNWIEEEKPVYESSDDALYRNVMAQIAKNEETLKNQKNAN